MSRAEAILRALVTALSGALSVPVHRDLTVALGKGSPVAVAIEAGDEMSPYAGLTGVTDRSLEVTLFAAGRGTDPWALADGALVPAWASIAADRTLGGLALDLSEGPTRRERDALETEIAVIGKTITIRFRTAENSLE